MTTARHRERSLFEPNGSYRWVSQDALKIVATAIDSTVTNAGSVVMDDYTSPYPYPDHTLDLTRKSVRRARLVGYGHFKGSSRNWAGDVTAFRPGGSFSSPYKCWPTSIPSPAWSYYTTKALANINPNVPVVDLPVFLYELKDLPEMIRGLGDVLRKKVHPSKVAGGYLAYRFGWAPLFQDIAKLLDFADAVEQRKKLLLAAARSGGTRIQRGLGSTRLSFGQSADQAVTLQGCPLSVSYWSFDGTQEYWFTAKLKLISTLTTSTLNTDALRSVLGLRASAATVWEAIPWSWLIDYFVNFGDFFNASRGGIRYKVDDFNLMCHTIIEGHEYSRMVHPDLVFIPGYSKYEYKGRRQPSIVTPKIALRPFWTNGMKAIAAALVTQRAFRSVGH